MPVASAPESWSPQNHRSCAWTGNRSHIGATETHHMNRKEHASPPPESLANPSVIGAEPPPAELLLDWMHVIYQPDHESEELDFEEALSTAPHASAPRLA